RGRGGVFRGGNITPYERIVIRYHAPAVKPAYPGRAKPLEVHVLGAPIYDTSGPEARLPSGVGCAPIVYYPRPDHTAGPNCDVLDNIPLSQANRRLAGVVAVLQRTRQVHRV